MTQAEMQNHPFFQLFSRRLSVVINGCQQRGMVSPNEVGVLTNILKNSYPQMHQFVENLVMRYSEINDNQMDNEIFNWLQAPIQQARLQVQRMTGGFGSGFGTGVAPWGGGGGAPRGFGYDSFNRGAGIPSSPFSAGSMFSPGNPGMGVARGRDNFAAPPKSDVTSLLGTPSNSNKPADNNQQSKVVWKEPEAGDTSTWNLSGEVEITMNKYSLANNTDARELIVYDPRVGYTSDSEVLEKYRKVFNIFPSTRRKVLTVCYQQVKVIHAPQEELQKLTMAICACAGKVNGVEAKLRAMIATASHFNKCTYEEFSKLFIDEVEKHINCGELCDSAHPKQILNRPDKLEDILDWVTGDINKDMLAALNGMKGFREKLNKLLEILIEEFASGLHKRIINVRTDMTALSTFYRALPGAWTNDCGITVTNTEDLVNLFLATRETIEGSKTASAVSADSALKKKLEELTKEYTMIFVPRVATWCNYSKADVCKYDTTGNCQPACFSKLQPRNDVEFFTNKMLEMWTVSRDTMLKWAPRNIHMEIDEETYVLQYGRTTDDCTWVGTAIYWH